MPGTSLLALLDDLTTLLDDVAVLSKVATKKAAGVLGDDLALNAEQVAGLASERELPVVWAVAKGSAWNKVILVPAALAISAFGPGLVTPLLMCGGAFLCFEGAEKLHGKWVARGSPAVPGGGGGDAAEAARDALREAARDGSVDLVAFERDKIRGAVRTDFVLSAEIVVIVLGAIAGAPLASRVGTLVAVAAGMTVGVYGLVAAIVKLDDLGLLLARRGPPLAAVGRGLLAFAPWLMKALSVGGTIAMFSVGGQILAHGIGPVDRAIAAWTTGLGGAAGWMAAVVATIVFGVAAGAALVAIVHGVGAAVRRVRNGQPA
jgi:predicted DNA repair protein MutK